MIYPECSNISKLHTLKEQMNCSKQIAKEEETNERSKLIGVKGQVLEGKKGAINEKREEYTW